MDHTTVEMWNLLVLLFGTLSVLCATMIVHYNGECSDPYNTEQFDPWIGYALLGIQVLLILLTVTCLIISRTL